MRWVSLALALLLLLFPLSALQAQDKPSDARREGDRPGPPAEAPMDARPDAPPPPGDRGPDRHWRDRDDHMSPEQARDAIEVVRRIDPDKAKELDKALKENPEQVARLLHESFPNLGRLMAWRRYDPEGFDLYIDDIALNRQIHESAKRLHDAIDQGNDEGAAFEQVELEGLVSKHFEVRKQIREHQLAKLKQRIAFMQGMIEKMQTDLDQEVANRDDLIAKRLDELIKGKPDGPVKPDDFSEPGKTEKPAE